MLDRVPGRDAGTHPPEAIGELHRLLLTFRQSRRCHAAGDPLHGSGEMSISTPGEQPGTVCSRRQSGPPYTACYFRDPAMIPLVRVLWNSKKNRMHGRTPSSADEAVVVASMKFCPWSTEIAIARSASSCPEA